MSRLESEQVCGPLQQGAHRIELHERALLDRGVRLRPAARTRDREDAHAIIRHASATRRKQSDLDCIDMCWGAYKYPILLGVWRV